MPVETPKPSYTTTSSLNTPSVVPSKPPVPKIEADPLVKEIQKQLLLLGYSPGPADGYIGSRTIAQIKVFQAKNNLPVDGKATYQLLSSLKDAQTYIQHRKNKTLMNNSKTDSESSIPIQKIQPAQIKNSFSGQNPYYHKCERLQEEMYNISEKMRGNAEKYNVGKLNNYNALYMEYQQYCVNR